MQISISGCIDCPLFDKTGTEYHVYCHHPKRPLIVTVSDMANNHKQVEPTEKEKQDYISLYLTGGNNYDELEILRNKSWKHNRYPSVNEPEILNDEEYNPITPDWCPLNSEPITIKKV